MIPPQPTRRKKCHISAYLSLLSQLYAIAVKDLIRKSDRSYKVKSRNSTVEYTLNKLEPGGKYHVVVQLGNMSKEASVKVTTGEQGGARPACRGSASAPSNLRTGQGSAGTPLAAAWWPGLCGSSMAVVFHVLSLSSLHQC